MIGLRKAGYTLVFQELAKNRDMETRIPLNEAVRKLYGVTLDDAKKNAKHEPHLREDHWLCVFGDEAVVLVESPEYDGIWTKKCFKPEAPVTSRPQNQEALESLIRDQSRVFLMGRVDGLRSAERILQAMANDLSESDIKHCLLVAADILAGEIQG